MLLAREHALQACPAKQHLLKLTWLASDEAPWHGRPPLQGGTRELANAGIPVSVAAGVVLDEAKALGVAGLLVARQVHLRAAAVLLKHVPQRAHIIVVLQDTGGEISR